MPQRTLKTAAEIAQEPIAERTERIFGALAIYHNHRAVGLEQLPEDGCLVVVNHSLATYDFGLLALRIFQHTAVCWKIRRANKPKSYVAKLWFTTTRQPSSGSCSRPTARWLW